MSMLNATDMTPMSLSTTTGAIIQGLWTYSVCNETVAWKQYTEAFSDLLSTSSRFPRDFRLPSPWLNISSEATG